jgi:hypothetical protein
MVFFDTLILAIFGVWLFLVVPKLIFSLSPRTMKTAFLEGPEPSADAWPQAREFAEQLKSHGFEFLGIKTERLPLWGHVRSQWSYACPREHSFATVYFHGKRSNFYYYTPFESGEVILTANRGFPEVDGPCARIKNASDSSGTRMLDEHRQAVQEFINRGCRPYAVFDGASRIRSTRQFYTLPKVRRRLLRIGILYLILLAVMTALVVHSIMLAR